jgi:hypothetical protein
MRECIKTIPIEILNIRKTLIYVGDKFKYTSLYYLSIWNQKIRIIFEFKTLKFSNY